MQVFAIFNEKGGTGKSTLTALMTAWLAYSQGERVCVLDFDHPSYQFATWREKELECPDTFASLASGRPYPLMKVPVVTADEMREMVSRLKASGDGYLFLEFGGSFREGSDDPSYVLLTSGLVDRLVIPVNTDAQTTDAAMYTVMKLKGLERKGLRIPQMRILWNGISGNERRQDGRHDWFSVSEVHFRALGAKVCSRMVKRNEILSREAPFPMFIRNTLCWPQKHVRFMQLDYLEDIFRELTEK